ncbi:MAG: type III secretion system chaperone [Kiritimatiellae bacterium]|nr:type III secretion system chaperone [Kiritimatiellia bacterium]
MTHAELLHELGERAGVELELSEAGTAAVKFDGDEIDFEADDGKLYIYAAIASADGREGVFGKLLEANNLLAGTNGATIGLDRERDTFTLCRMFEGETEYAVFERAVAGFVTALRLIRRELAGEGDSADRPQPDLGHRLGGHFLHV